MSSSDRTRVDLSPKQMRSTTNVTPDPKYASSLFSIGLRRALPPYSTHYLLLGLLCSSSREADVCSPALKRRCNLLTSLLSTET